MSDCKAAGSGIQSGPAGIDLIGQVAALSCNRKGKLEKTKYLFCQRIVLGRFISKCAKKILKLPPVPAIQSAKLVPE